MEAEELEMFSIFKMKNSILQLPIEDWITELR